MPEVSSTRSTGYGGMPAGFVVAAAVAAAAAAAAAIVVSLTVFFVFRSLAIVLCATVVLCATIILWRRRTGDDQLLDVLGQVGEVRVVPDECR